MLPKALAASKRAQEAGTLRVAHYLWSADTGGIERVVLDLATAQAQTATVEPAVVFGRGQGAMREFYDDAGISAHVAGLSRGIDLSPRAYRRLREAFDACDVIHMHAYHPLAGRAAVNSRKPIVFTLHGAFGWGREKQLSERIKHTLIARFLRHHADCVTVNSEFTAREAVRRYGVTNTRVVLNGTRLELPDDPLNDPELESWLGDGFVVGVVGRFVPFKRPERVLEALARTASKKVRLVFVGDGPTRGSCEALARDLGVQDRVRFVGTRNPATPLQRRFDLCVAPGEAEAFGLTTVEAFALGIPAIVFRDGGGLVEIVEPHCADDVVTNVDRLAQRIDAYARRDDSSSSDARRDYAARFGLPAFAAGWEAVYRELV